MKYRGRFHSTDTTGGWRNHYRRMLRWKQRTENLATVHSGPQVDPAEAIDFALAYFVWAHSLKDWLIADGAVEEKKLKEFLFAHHTWRMCSELANRSRHFDQTNKHVVDKYWSMKRTFDPFQAQITGENETGLAIWYDGKRRQVLNIVREVNAMWDDVIANFKLDPSQPQSEAQE